MALHYNPQREAEDSAAGPNVWTVALVLALISVGIAYFLAYRHEEPPDLPKPKVYHLAPEGTFYVLEYISVPIKSGVIGFEPGREVHLVKVLNDKHKLLVSDGAYQAEAAPDQLTNDLDIAEMARSHDASSQAKVLDFLSKEKANYEKATLAQNEQQSKDVDSYNHHLNEGVAIGTQDGALNRGAEPTRTVVGPTGYYVGNPYSYLYPAYHPYPTY